jgi:hypothetical protein
MTLNILDPQAKAPAQAGIACPRCGSVTRRSTFILHCGSCGDYHRELPACHFEPVPAGALPHEQEVPPERAQWIGYVRDAGAEWLPVAKAPTLGQCWDALLNYPGNMAMLCCWVLPIERAEAKPTGVVTR